MRISVVLLVLVLAFVSGKLVEDNRGDPPSEPEEERPRDDVKVVKRETFQPDTNTTDTPATSAGEEALAAERGEEERPRDDVTVVKRETSQTDADTTDTPATSAGEEALAAERGEEERPRDDVTVVKRETSQTDADTTDTPATSAGEEALAAERGEEERPREDVTVVKRETSQPDTNTTDTPATSDREEALAAERDEETGRDDANEDDGAMDIAAISDAEGGRDIVVEKRETRGPMRGTVTPPTSDPDREPTSEASEEEEGENEDEEKVSEEEENKDSTAVRPSDTTSEDDPGTVQGEEPKDRPSNPDRPKVVAEDDISGPPDSIQGIMVGLANDTAGNSTESATNASSTEASEGTKTDEMEPETTSDVVSSTPSDSATTDAASSSNPATKGESPSKNDPEKVPSDDDPTVGATSATATSATTTDGGTNETINGTATTNEGTDQASNGTSAAEADATEGSTNATASEGASTIEATTTPTTTTTTEEPLPPIIAKVRSTTKITNHDFKAWMSLQITKEFKAYSAKLTSIFLPVLQRDMGASMLGLKIVSLSKGSVVVHMDVTVQTNTSNISAVDTEAVAAEVRTSLQQVIQTGDMDFDPSAVTADADSIELFAPTEPPPSLEELYESSFIRLVMRAPNANYTEDYNNTDSEAFKDLEANIDQGIKDMLAKKFPSPQWNKTATLEAAWNDTTKGVGVRFMVEIQPQWANTTAIVSEMAKNYVFFSRIGSLQIDPSSVEHEDLTTYAPGEGMVVKGPGYIKGIMTMRFNGSYVGDYTTPRPTLRPIVKRHHANIMGIALPAFLAMLSVLGLLLICTTIAQGKKSVD